ncbi:MAG: hypothetical protein M1365_16105 [Actinobacteria bacterium]|nr:hypothetical protein [Actinomycetota bacterium]
MAFRPEIGLFANNSVSDQALLCHFFYADIASYTPKIKSGPDFQQILRFSLDQYLDGAPSFGIDFHPNPTISLLNSVWDYLAGTGDWDWAYARVDKIEKHVDELIASEYKETGLFATARSGVSFKWDGSSSWWDSFTSGPFESYFNALGYIACNRMADLMRRLDRKKKSNVLTDLAKRIRENYFKFFYNPATKCIAQWVDKEGKMHDYICHAPLGAAIYAGLVNTEDSIAMLRSYLHRLETSGFSHFEYGLPLVLEPVPMQDHMPWIGQSTPEFGMDNFQIYQNGGVTLAHTYWIIMALYKTNMRSEATALLKKLSMNILDCRASGSLNSGVDWRSWDGKVVGYEGLLAEQFHILLSTINGYLGVSNSLDGLKISRNIPGLISNDPKSQIFPDFGFVNDTV